MQRVDRFADTLDVARIISECSIDLRKTRGGKYNISMIRRFGFEKLLHYHEIHTVQYIRILHAPRNKQSLGVKHYFLDRLSIRQHVMCPDRIIMFANGWLGIRRFSPPIFDANPATACAPKEKIAAKHQDDIAISLADHSPHFINVAAVNSKFSSSQIPASGIDQCRFVSIEPELMWIKLAPA